MCVCGDVRCQYFFLYYLLHSFTAVQFFFLFRSASMLTLTTSNSFANTVLAKDSEIM